MNTLLPPSLPLGGSHDDERDTEIEDALRGLSDWNIGVLGTQILQWHITPKHFDLPPSLPGGTRGGIGGSRGGIGLSFENGILKPSGKPKIDKAPYQAVQMAMSGVFKQILHKYNCYFELAQFETTLPIETSIEERQQIYNWKDGDGFPPHLDVIPEQDRYDMDVIFNKSRLDGVRSLFQQVIPKELQDLNPSAGTTLEGVTQYNQELVAEKKNIYIHQNVGTRTQEGKKNDWYTDAVFAQQHLTGTNPTTIKSASQEWVRRFKDAAVAQEQSEMANLLDTAANECELYMQDYSDFRQLVGAKPDEILTSTFTLYADEKQQRWAVAPVCLFRLSKTDGILHPLAVIIDYLGDMESSVVIFNKRLSPTDDTVDQATDWPWRYAKTCVQVGDWYRHELAAHLSLTHLVEEAVIVAAHRSFLDDHPVYRLLKPHWLKTLSVNAAARSVLVPVAIFPISGLPPQYVSKFVIQEYLNFDWTARYVPNDLASRGFPLDELHSSHQFHNYAYARNILLMWQTLRKFVASFLAACPSLATDHQIAHDEGIQNWVSEMRNAGQMAHFPDIKTRESLIDIVTMCIHLASPQHTAVNYTQEYYQTFVVNKPPSFFTPPPTSLSALTALTEADLVKALPMNQLRVWLISAQLPFLLNETVAAKENLPTYVLTLYQTAKANGERKIMKAAKRLYLDLRELGVVFKKVSAGMDADTGGYSVMDPEVTAVSVLI